MICPRCGEAIKFQRYRSKSITSLMGDIQYDRAYYHGCDCHCGLAPTDAQFGLEDKVTPAAAEVLTLEGSLVSFEEAAVKILPKSSGLNVSASSVQRVTERTGRDLAERQNQGEVFGPQENWDWHVDRRGRACAYLSLDATGVGQQAEDGSQKPGRMAWVGEIYNPTPIDHPRRNRIWEARYHAGLMSLSEIGKRLGQTAQAVGLEQADVVIGLTDGGAGLEDCLLDYVFAGRDVQIEFILDFYHVSEHVYDFCQQLHAGDSAAIEDQAQAWCHLLKHSGGDALLQALLELDLDDRSASVVNRHRQLCGYLRNNQHRTDYPRYQEQGWHIGSGTIESACKNVVNARLNGTGMRWSEHGTTELCHVRALFKSQPGVWDDYWSRSPTHSAA